MKIKHNLKGEEIKMSKDSKKKLSITSKIIAFVMLLAMLAGTIFGVLFYII